LTKFPASPSDGITEIMMDKVASSAADEKMQTETADDTTDEAQFTV